MVVELVKLSDSKCFVVHRFGRAGARPKVYLQGGLHADEVAPTMALARLTHLLSEAEQNDCIAGEIIVVPHCNPIGLTQFIHGRHNGRFAFDDGSNFNRGFPDLAAATGVMPNLDRATIVKLGRRFLSQPAEETGVAELQRQLMALSWGADLVIDVHADMEANVHSYSSVGSWRKLHPLADRMEASVVILSDDSADLPFDEAHSRAWRDLGMIDGVASCTLELRGLADVSETLADKDAEGLFLFLRDIGAIRMDHAMSSISNSLMVELEQIEFVTSPANGILLHVKAVGDRVHESEVIAKLFDPASRDIDQAWIAVRANCDGLTFARWHQRVIDKGMVICKIASPNTKAKQPGRLLD